MKFFPELTFALLLAGSWGNIHAQGCGLGGRPFGNTTLGTFGPYTGMVNDVDIFARAYDIVAPAANNSGSCTAGVPNNIFPTLAGNHGFNSSWSSACNTGCLPSGGGRMVGFVSNRTGEGTVAHSGQFVVATAGWNAVANKWNLDLVANGNGGNAGCPGGITCQVRPGSIPRISHSADPATGATYNHALGTGRIRVSFTQPAVRGFFDVDPGADLITGYEIRQINVPDSVCGVIIGPSPTVNARAAWGAILTTAPAGGITNADCSAGSCTKLVQVTAIPNCNRAYFSLAYVVGGNWSTDFVSANSNSLQAGPTATSGLPSRVEIYPRATGRIPGVQIRWTTTNETQIAGFNLFASRTASGGYLQMNDNPLPAAGSPNTYLQSISSRTFVTRLGLADTYNLKLVTLLRDGGVHELAPVSFTLPEPVVRGGKEMGREGRASALVNLPR